MKFGLAPATTSTSSMAPDGTSAASTRPTSPQRYGQDVDDDAHAEAIVIIGAGGHGRELLDVVDALGSWSFLGFIDDGSPDLDVLARRSAPLLGPVSALEHLDAQ